MKNFDSEKTFNDFVEMVDKKIQNLDEFSIAGNIRNARQEGELVYDYTNEKGKNVTGIFGYQNHLL